MELLFLGTGAGVPSKIRNVSAMALQLLQEKRGVWLFDCGEATQHQILNTPIRPRKIEKIFISHLHGDHIFGLPGLLGSRSFQDGTTPLTIYGPEGIKSFVETSLQVSQTCLKYPLSIVEIQEGVICEDDAFTVEAKKLVHGVSSYGYRIVEKDSPGELLVEELKKLGITPGPIYKDIKEGKDVTLPSGEIVNGRQFVGENKKGRSLAYIVDTRICDAGRALAENCDVLIHESTFSHEDASNAHDYYHTTSTEAAELAMRAGVRQLVLTHISSRYKKEDLEDMLQAAKEIFPNTTLASDFCEVSITRASVEAETCTGSSQSL